MASTRVLGLSFEALGLGVSKSWGLPESIQRCIVKPSGDPPNQTIKDPQSRLRWGTRAANEMADAMLQADDQEVDAQMLQAAKRYGKTLGLSLDNVKAATATARKKLVELADAMDIRPRSGSAAERWLKGPDNARPDLTQSTLLSPSMLASTELQATTIYAAAPLTFGPGDQALPRKTDQAAQTLAAGIQDITNAMVEDFKLSDVLRMILEAMFRALEFHRIVFCMRDAKTDTLTGRFGLGSGVEGVVKAFCVPMQTSGTPDLFATICSKGADTLISDASDPRIAERLPAWYHKSYHAPTFLILPLLLKGKPFGLIYADKADKGSLAVDEKELSLLRTLRNQAVMAFKQSS